ncbi:MAG: hypothetical protein ACJ789_06220 [Thermomicrobiales bacterium]
MMISNTACYLLGWTGQRWMRRLFGAIGDEVLVDSAGSPSRAALFTTNGWPNLELYDANLMIDVMEEEMHVPDLTTVYRNDLTGDPLTIEEQKARAAAVRGLVNARDGRFEKARTLFGEALLLDRALDLSQIPTFWKLPRGGQDAAVDAYHDAGMQKEAKLLSSNLNYHFRPKLVRRRPLVIQST